MIANSKWWLVLALLILLNACSSEEKEEPWCDSRTIANLQGLQGSDPRTNWCATVEANLVFRKDQTKGCGAGAYYLEDSTGLLFVCDPTVKTADPEKGIVVCSSDVTRYDKDTSLFVEVKAEGLYYPAKEICDELLCHCQNGIEVDRLEKP